MAAEQPYHGKGSLVWKSRPELEDWALVVNYGSDLFTSLVNAVSGMGLNVYYINHKFCSDKVLVEVFSKHKFKAIILSGSARSVNELNPPAVHPALLTAGIPVLAICYSMEWIAKISGTPVILNRSGKREEGPTKLEIVGDSILWKGLDRENIEAHMFHLYEVSALPEGFRLTAKTADCEIAAFERDNLICTQFHPEYPLSISGKMMLKNFLREVCGVSTLMY